MAQKILIIEDDSRIAEWTKVYFEREGILADIASDGEEGLKLAQTQSYDLLVLDLMLPKLSGEEVCKSLRVTSDIPIIMLTAKGAHSEQIKGLDLGADDYIVKPFDANVLLARAKAVMRRYNHNSNNQSILTCGEPLVCGDLRLDLQNQVATLGQKQLKLSVAQLSILKVFMQHSNQVLSRDRLINLAFDDFDGFDRAIDTHIKRLRKQLHHEDFQPIQTVYGAGYKFSCKAY